MNDIEEKPTNHTLLKWVLASVGAGLVGIGMFAQVTFSSFMASGNEERKFLREDLRQSLREVSDLNAAVLKAQEISNANQQVVVRAIDAQTKVLEEMKQNQEKGLRITPQPPPTGKAQEDA